MNSLALHIDGQVIEVMPDAEHEYLLTTEQVAAGYGVAVETIRTHKRDHADELAEGKHFLSVGIPNARPGRGAQTQTVWTKRGIVRLGFFIRSERAARFRDMAEDLVVQKLTPPALAPDFAHLERLAGLTAQAIEARVSLSENTLRAEITQALGDRPIQGSQPEEIRRRIEKLAKLMGGSRANYSEAWRRFKDRFSVAAYRDLLNRQFDDAIHFLDLQIASYGDGRLLDGGA